MTAQPRQPEAATVPSAGDGRRQRANRVMRGIISLLLVAGIFRFALPKLADLSEVGRPSPQ